jgi:hypothetical protein
MHQAFLDLRYLDGQQAHDLAYAFHNIPQRMYGPGSGDVEEMRGMLQHYQKKYVSRSSFDYVAAFDVLFQTDIPSDTVDSK